MKRRSTLSEKYVKASKSPDIKNDTTLGDSIFTFAASTNEKMAIATDEIEHPNQAEQTEDTSMDVPMENIDGEQTEDTSMDVPMDVSIENIGTGDIGIVAAISQEQKIHKQLTLQQMPKHRQQQ